jgi:hypothetical protein
MLTSLVLIFLRFLVPAEGDSYQLDHGFAESLRRHRRGRGAWVLAGYAHL